MAVGCGGCLYFAGGFRFGKWRGARALRKGFMGRGKVRRKQRERGIGLGCTLVTFFHVVFQLPGFQHKKLNKFKLVPRKKESTEKGKKEN